MKAAVTTKSVLGVLGGGDTGQKTGECMSEGGSEEGDKPEGESDTKHKRLISARRVLFGTRHNTPLLLCDCVARSLCHSSGS